MVEKDTELTSVQFGPTIVPFTLLPDESAVTNEAPPNWLKLHRPSRPVAVGTSRSLALKICDGVRA